MAMNQPAQRPRLRRRPVTSPDDQLQSLEAFASDPFINMLLALQDPIFAGFGPQIFNDLVRQAHAAPVLPGTNTLSPLPFSDAAMAQMFVTTMNPVVEVEEEEPTPKRNRSRSKNRRPGNTTVNSNMGNRDGRGVNPRSARNSVANLSRG